MDHNNIQKQAPSCAYSLAPRQIVASVLTSQSQIALFKRSQRVSGDCGLWHCITGFIDSATSPLEHAKGEIKEEAGINSSQLSLVNSGLICLDDQGGNSWKIHVYHFETATRKLKTNWEHDAAIWSHLDELDTFETVSWLPDIIEALQFQNHQFIGCDVAEPQLNYAV